MWQNIERYDVSCQRGGFEYFFYSVGNKGSIKKAAQFEKSPVPRIFQFRFGDVDECTGEIDEYAVTDNHDTTVVLNTLAWIINDFLSCFPDSIVRFSGSTKSRTRLFLMWFGQHWDISSKYFLIFGSKSDEYWEKFKPNVRYGAVLMKKNNIS